MQFANFAFPGRRATDRIPAVRLVVLAGSVHGFVVTPLADFGVPVGVPNHRETSTRLDVSYLLTTAVYFHPTIASILAPYGFASVFFPIYIWN